MDDVARRKSAFDEFEANRRRAEMHPRLRVLRGFIRLSACGTLTLSLGVSTWRHAGDVMFHGETGSSDADSRKGPVHKCRPAPSTACSWPEELESRTTSTSTHFTVTAFVAEPPRLLLTVMFCGLVDAVSCPLNLPPLPDSVPSSWPLEVTKT